MDFETRVIDLLKATHDLEDLSKKVNTNLFDLCEHLYKTVSALTKTDAFYVGLYDEDNEQIGFPYTVDNGKWEKSDYQPLGNGPTSWVIRNRTSFILGEENISLHQSGSYFGNMKKSSKSAIHSPMFTTTAEQKEILVGVISIQSYETGVYDKSTIEFFKLLARSAGRIFLPFVEKNSAIALRKKLAQQANTYNKFLFDITKELDSIKKLIKRSAPEADILQLIDTCSNYCKEIQASMISGDFRSSTLKEEIKEEAIKNLTPIQRRIVEKILEGKENITIAAELRLSHEAVRKQVQKICDELGIEKGRGRTVKLYNLFHTSV